MASKVMPEAAGAEGVAANVPKESHELRRAVGVWGSYTWGYADVGADVYVALGIVMAAAQGATNVAFLFAGLVYVMVGLAYTELAAAYPMAGGGQFYVLRGLGDLWGFVAGWAVLLDFTIDISLFALASAGYINFFFPMLNAHVDISLLGLSFPGVQPLLILEATILVAFLTVLNILGVRESTRFNEILGALDVTSESAILFFGFLFAFNLTLLIHALAFSTLSLAMLPWQTVVAHNGDPVAWLASHIPILGLFIGPYVALLGSTLLLISANSGVFGASRITYSMARFNLLPRWFSKVHSRFRTPVRTLVVFSGIALVELFLAGLSPNAYDVLANMYAFGAAAAYMLVFVSLLVLRFKDPWTPRPFKVPLNIKIRGKDGEIRLLPIVGILGFLGISSILILVVLTHAIGRIAGPSWIILGLLIYFWYRHRKKLPLSKTLKRNWEKEQWDAFK